MNATRNGQSLPWFNLVLLLLGALGAMLLVGQAGWPATSAEPLPATQGVSFCGELQDLLAHQAEIAAVLYRLQAHLAAYPDTSPEVTLGALDYLWRQTRHHAERLATLNPPQTYEPAMVAYTEWLDALDQGIGYDWEYCEYQIWLTQDNGIASQYSEGYQEHASIAAFYYRRADQAWARFERALATVAEPCP